MGKGGGSAGWALQSCLLTQYYKALQYTRWARPLLFTCVRANARDAESECVFVRFIMCLALHDRFVDRFRLGPAVVENTVMQEA